ncbi:MAG TPA: hypothetical protein VGD43_08290, partial [Micromonospora sp.]
MTTPNEPQTTGSGSTPAGGPPGSTPDQPYTHQEYDPNGTLPPIPGLPGGVFDTIGEIVQRSTLAQGLTYRPAGNPPTTNAAGLTHEQLKGSVESADPGSANEVGETWTRLGNRMMDFGNALLGTANSSQAQWQGAAGEAARSALSQLADWSGQTGQGLQFTATNLRTQAEAAATVRTMPDPVPYDPMSYYRQMLATPNPAAWAAIAADAREQYEAHVAARNEAIEKVNNYSAALISTDATMPAFSPPPTFGSVGPGEGTGTGQPGTGITTNGGTVPTTSPGTPTTPQGGPGPTNGGPLYPGPG